MRHSIKWLLLSAFLLLAVIGQAQTEQLIVTEYERLKALLVEDSVTVEAKKDIRYFLGIALPFYQLAKSPDGYKGMQLPEYLVRSSPSRYKSTEGKEDWLNSSNGLLRDLSDFGDTPLYTIGGKLFNISLVEDPKGQLFPLLDKPQYILKNNPLFEKISKAILAFNHTEILENASQYNDKVTAMLLLYDRKYKHGYRNRNVLEYFVNGGLQGMKQRAIKKNGNETFLKPPSRYEVILLANPILGVGSPSFKKFKNDPNSVYLMVQLLGVDIHSKDFKKYTGVSLFHASPVNTSLQFFTRPQLGIEVHYKKLNLGFGIEYPKFKANDSSNYGMKFFVSFAAFDAVFKKRTTASSEAGSPLLGK